MGYIKLPAYIDRYVSINEQLASYSLSLSDDGRLVDMNVAIACTLTIPTDAIAAFPIGTNITIRQKGAGQVTITPFDGTVILQYKDGLKTAGQYGVAALIKIAANTWAVFGALVA